MANSTQADSEAILPNGSERFSLEDKIQDNLLIFSENLL